MPNLNSIPGEAVAWREVDGEFVLISIETTHYYSLNATGSDVWRALLEGPQTAVSIAGALAAHHGLDHQTVEPDVTGLLAELASEGLVRVEEASVSHLPAGASALTGPRTYERPSLSKYDALERLILSGE